MASFRKGIQVARINIYRWKSDYRIWLIFAFTGVLIIYYLNPYINYCLAENKKITFCLLPLLYVPSDISVGAPKMFWHIGYLIMLCDAPFMHENMLYTFLRGGRKSRYWGECIYIFVTAVIYMGFIALVSAFITLPAVSFKNEWGNGITDYLFGSEKYELTQLVAVYPRKIPLPEDTIKYLYPIASEIFTFFVGMSVMFILGLILYLFSMISNYRYLGLAVSSIIVFMEPIITWCAEPRSYYLQFFSPVSWTSIEHLNLLEPYYKLNIPFIGVAIGFAVLLLLLILYFVNIKEEY